MTVIKPAVQMVEQAARHIYGSRRAPGQGEFENLPQVTQDRFTAEAQGILDAAFVGVAGDSWYWLGEAAASEGTRMIYTIPTGAGAGILMVADGEKAEAHTLPHSVNFTFRKNGEISSFQVSKIRYEEAR